MASQIQNSQKIDEEKLKEKASKISIAEGSAYSVMDGFGFKYITPYALALGVSNTFVGLLSSLPGLIGNLSQIPGSKAIEKRSRKKVVIGAVILQTLMWLPLFLVGVVAFLFKPSVFFISFLLILIYTLLVTLGSFAGPAWSSWMKDIITKNIDSYFAKRNVVCGIVGLIATLIAGILLNYFNQFHFLLGFGIIFSIALIGRGISAYLFTKKYEPRRKKVEGYYFSFFQFVGKMSMNNFGKFVIFSSMVSFATAIASPFFAVYMLKNLGFNYFSYTLVVTSSIIFTLVSMPFWGKLGDKYGDISLIKMTGYLIFLVPVLWIVVPIYLVNFPNFVLPYLILIEVFSGVIWAGFNLSTRNFIYHAVTPQRIALCAAYTAVLTSFGAFLGATLGGLLSSYNGNFFFVEPIIFVFALSSVLRFLSVIIFLPKLKEVRKVEKFDLEVGDLAKKIGYFPKHVLDTLGIKRLWP